MSRLAESLDRLVEATYARYPGTRHKKMKKSEWREAAYGFWRMFVAILKPLGFVSEDRGGMKISGDEAGMLFRYTRKPRSSSIKPGFLGKKVANVLKKKYGKYGVKFPTVKQGRSRGRSRDGVITELSGGYFDDYVIKVREFYAYDKKGKFDLDNSYVIILLGAYGLVKGVGIPGW